jgi:SAM-dependent methyltransferase/uncharacterized protein YbaR (Trm112 family)
VWKRFVSVLRCPLCGGEVSLEALAEQKIDVGAEHLESARARGVPPDALVQYVDEGILWCGQCDVSFPIVDGLPILLPYETPAHREFAAKWSARRAAEQRRLRFPSGKPVPGEQFVLKSFSSEWLAYDYDGVIWESSYAAHKARVLKEIGPAVGGSHWSLEIGCGLGLATSVIQEASAADAVGLDLSLAVLKAARAFRTNPFMHFVQASAFAIPLRRQFFDVVYSRGVLHHTYSTRLAFERVAQHSRRGGTVYLWLYGPGSIRSTPLRVILFGIEAVTRPLVSRSPDALPAQLFLRTMALGYMAFNRLRRLFNQDVQSLSFARALHAARDRFTPRFAHRHAAQEVASWFAAASFERVEILDWRQMPPSEREDFRRNVGVRAMCAAPSTGAQKAVTLAPAHVVSN